jgi:coenzyme F420-reducing hydrogenase alpha subunit
VRIVADYRHEADPGRIECEPRGGEGCHATEAPRGAKIVPPTSQNQGQIEDDLRAFVPRVLQADDATATRHCEHLIRNYDPCISCATHFLKLTVDRRESSHE